MIFVDLDRVPARVKALFVIGTVATDGVFFDELKSARMRVLYLATDTEVCRYLPGLTGDSTAQFFCRIARRDDLPAMWVLSAIGDVDKSSRDFGSLVPEVRCGRVCRARRDEGGVDDRLGARRPRALRVCAASAPSKRVRRSLREVCLCVRGYI